jgi:hypothetical protein
MRESSVKRKKFSRSQGLGADCQSISTNTDHAHAKLVTHTFVATTKENSSI